MKEKIEINTVLGKLSAELSGDPTYPGIVICVEMEDEDGVYAKQLALAECTPDMPVEGGHSLRLLVWNSDNTDDYTNDFTFLEETPDEEDKSIVWDKYLQYLRIWSESHNGPGFYGMTPACFSEWLNCDYQKSLEEGIN